MRDSKTTTGVVVITCGAVTFGLGMLLSASGLGACVGLPLAALAVVIILVGVILLVVAAGKTPRVATTTDVIAYAPQSRSPALTRPAPGSTVAQSAAFPAESPGFLSAPAASPQQDLRVPAAAPGPSEPLANPPLRCTHCGSSLSVETAFCTECGTRSAKAPLTSEA